MQSPSDHIGYLSSSLLSPDGLYSRLKVFFCRFRSRAIFAVGGVFLGYNFGYGYLGYYPAWYCSQYPYGYNHAVGCYYPYPGPALLTAVSLLNPRTSL
jgi:hypothetical protein